MDDDDGRTLEHDRFNAALPWEDTFDLPNVDSTNSLWCEAPGNLGGDFSAWLVSNGKHPFKAIQNISNVICVESYPPVNKCYINMFG